MDKMFGLHYLSNFEYELDFRVCYTGEKCCKLEETYIFSEIKLKINKIESKDNAEL